VCRFSVRSASRNCHVSPRGRWLRQSAMQASSSAKTSNACVSAPIASATRRNKSSNPELAVRHFAGRRSGFAVLNDPRLGRFCSAWTTCGGNGYLPPPVRFAPLLTAVSRHPRQLGCRQWTWRWRCFVAGGAGEAPQHALCCPSGWRWRPSVGSPSSRPAHEHLRQRFSRCVFPAGPTPFAYLLRNERAYKTRTSARQPAGLRQRAGSNREFTIAGGSCPHLPSRGLRSRPRITLVKRGSWVESDRRLHSHSPVERSLRTHNPTVAGSNLAPLLL
jgi:hypothetical protein